MEPRSQKKKKGSAQRLNRKGGLLVNIDRDDRSEDTDPLNVINTIFGGPHIGDSNSERKRYARKAESTKYVNFAALINDELAYLHKAIRFTKEEAE